MAALGGGTKIAPTCSPSLTHALPDYSSKPTGVPGERGGFHAGGLSSLGPPSQVRQTSHNKCGRHLNNFGKKICDFLPLVGDNLRNMDRRCLPQKRTWLIEGDTSLADDAKGKGASGSHREAESTNASERGGLPRSSNEGPVMGLERRRWVNRC